MIDKLIRENSSWRNHPVDKETLDELNSYINISEEHKIILWLWKKCGTTHMARVMNNFGFKYYRIENGKLILHENSVVQKHYCNLFDGHENYKILAAVRNPYSRFFSDYTFGREKMDFVLNETNKEKFRIFIYESTVYSEILAYNCIDLNERIPDYAVRLESLYEDYSKIPFVIKSEYFKSGQLLKDIGKKINVSNDDESLWKYFYTQETADLIYYRMPKYFDLFGYDKNSWKS